MVNYSNEELYEMTETPRMTNRTKYQRVRPPQASRKKPGKPDGGKFGGVRLRRNKRWNW